MPLLWPRPSSVFAPPTTLDHFLTSPLAFLIYYLQALFLRLRGPAYTPAAHQRRPPIRVVCLSDTHSKIPAETVPDGDILIHAGDLASTGTAADIQAQIDWLKSLPHREKIVVGGNHDSFLDPRSRLAEDGGASASNGEPKQRRGRKPTQTPSLDWGPIHYLERRSITLAFPDHGNRKLHIYGAPQIPRCGGSDNAFQYDEEGSSASDMWTGTVPAETDVLVTHTPPRFHLDLPAGLGCPFLLKEVWRVRPTLHVFGHVHSGHGKEDVWWDEGQRAYERICAKRRKPRSVLMASGTIPGNPSTRVIRRAVGGMVDLTRTLFRDAFDVAGWIDGVRVVWHGVQGVLWSRVWGGAGAGSVMVNAALTYQTTNSLGNPVQVVEI